jgi:hypothetical protein
MACAGKGNFPVHSYLAYIDPGAGSLFVQAIVGGTLAALYAVKLYWHRLKAGLKSLRHRAKNPPEN